MIRRSLGETTAERLGSTSGRLTGIDDGRTPVINHCVRCVERRPSVAASIFPRRLTEVPLQALMV